jgi:putative oxidoreductase
MKHWIDLLARFFLSFIFLTRAGVMLYDRKATFLELLGSGWSWMPKFSLLVAVIFTFVGGLLVLLGYRAKLGAFMLIVVLVPVTIYFHDFWNSPEARQQDQLVEFMKNMAILGGLLMVLAHGSGDFSVKRIFATTRT